MQFRFANLICWLEGLEAKTPDGGKSLTCWLTHGCAVTPGCTEVELQR